MDVDGPLNPFAAPWFTSDLPEDGYTFHTVGPLPGFESLRIALNPAHGEWLRGLSTMFDLVWATTWLDAANRFISPRLGLPRDLPVVPLSRPRGWLGGASWKTAHVIEWVAGRPFCWFDDEINDATDTQLRVVRAPHLGVYIDPALGLLRDDVDLISRLPRDWGRADRP